MTANPFILKEKWLVMSKFIYILLLVSCIFVGTASAENLAVRNQDWMLIRTSKGVKPNCFALSFPYRTKSYSGTQIRQPAMQVIWQGPTQYSISISAGYELKDRTAMQLVDYENHYILKNGFDNSITYSSIQDVYLLNKLLLQEVDYFRVKSENADGFHAIDYYSLDGFFEILNLMDQVCS